MSKEHTENNPGTPQGQASPPAPKVLTKTASALTPRLASPAERPSPQKTPNLPAPADSRVPNPSRTPSAKLPKPDKSAVGLPTDSRDGLLRDDNTGDRANRPQPFTLERGSRIGDYVIEKALASGAMGEVWRGHHPVIGKRVAIKVLGQDILVSREAVSRFVQEARAVNEIRHRNIVDIFASGELPDGRPYLVMELLEGMPLSNYIHEKGPLPFSLLLDLMGQICRALGAAHDHGIVHRDLKSDNIFLVLERKAPPFVKLLDFGIAKLRQDQNPIQDLTRPGAVYGTPQYMSPEQCQAAGAVDHYTDIYSLGVVLFEMLTGRVPFLLNEEGVGILMIKHMMAAPPSPSSLVEGRTIPPEVDSLVKLMLAKKKTVRPANCEEVFEALQKAVGELRKEESIQAKPLPDDPANDLYTMIARPSSAQSGELPAEPKETLADKAQTEEPPATTELQPAPEATSSEAPSVLSDPPQPEAQSEPTSAQPEEIKSAVVQAPVAVAPPAKRRSFWLAALPLGFGVVTAVFFLFPSTPAPARPSSSAPTTVAVLPPDPIPPAPASVPAPHPEKVRLSLQTTPKGAKVFLGEEVLGVTPLETELTYGEQELTLRVQKSGFETLELRITPNIHYEGAHKLKAQPASKDKSKITFNPFEKK